MVEPKVFLGGTCAGSTWREKLIPQLELDYFNPVVDDWTPECKEEEIKQKKECNFRLYVITPKMKGVFSIAEAVDDSNKFPKQTIFCVLGLTSPEDGEYFDKEQISSLISTSRVIVENGGVFFSELEEVVWFLNTFKKEGLE